MSLTNRRIAAIFTGLTLGLVACSDEQPASDDTSTGGVPGGGTAGAATGGSPVGGTAGTATGGGVTGGVGQGGAAPTGGVAGTAPGGSTFGGASGTAGAPGGASGDAGMAGAPAGAGGAAGAGVGGTGGVTGGAAGAPAGAGGTGAGGKGGAGAGGAGAGGKGGTGGSGGGATTCSGTLSGFGGSASRPTLTPTQAACHTILSYLAKTGSVTAPTTDNWNPTAGLGDVTGLTATFTVGTTGGSTTHTTVQAAITAAVTMGGTNRINIRVMPGTYREVVCVPTNAPPITLYSTSTDASQTTIVYNNLAGTTVGTRPTNACSNPSGTTYGTSASATFAAFGAGFQAKNITFSNDGDEATAGSGTQGVALSTRNDKLVFENVRLLGNQDTLLVGTNNVANIMRAYFKSSYIEGDVDFICGRGTAVFDGGTIRLATNRRNNGNMLAPSTDSRNSYGFLVIGATLNAATGATGGGMTLGRAWDESQGDVATYTMNIQNGMAYPNGQSVVRDSTLGAHVNGTSPWAAAATTSRAFSSTPSGALPANRLWEYTNTGP